MFRALLLAASGILIVCGSVAAAAKDGEPGTIDQPETSRTTHQRAAAIARLEKKYSRRLEACNRGETAACGEASEISGRIVEMRARR